MSGVADELSQDAREVEEKLRLSDRGMAMDAEEIPHGAQQDPKDDTVGSPAHHDDEPAGGDPEPVG
jgi:hypothetical protein